MSNQQDASYGKKEFYEKRVPEHFANLKEHIDRTGFVLFFLAKKNAGKGTYAKILQNVTDNKIYHLAVGDLVRAAEKRALDPGQRQDLIHDVKPYYHGDQSIEDAIESFAKEAGDYKTLLPTEMVVALMEKAVSDHRGQAIIIDGFPRSKDQLELTMRMMDDFEQPSAFVEIDCPDEVIYQRQLYRVICPECQAPRNTKVLVTEEVGYDEEKDEVYLVCDNDTCDNVRMVRKKGDELTKEELQARQETVKELLSDVRGKASNLHLMVHNHIPVDEAGQHDPNDFTFEADLVWDSQEKQVKKVMKPWVVKDEEGRDVHSRWPDPVVADLVKEVSNWLDSLGKKE